MNLYFSGYSGHNNWFVDNWYLDCNFSTISNFRPSSSTNAIMYGDPAFINLNCCLWEYPNSINTINTNNESGIYAYSTGNFSFYTYENFIGNVRGSGIDFIGSIISGAFSGINDILIDLIDINQYVIGGYSYFTRSGYVCNCSYNYIPSGCGLLTTITHQYFSDGSGFYYQYHLDGYFSTGYFESGQLASGFNTVEYALDTCEWRFFPNQTGISYIYSNDTPQTGIIYIDNFWFTFANGQECLADGPYSNGYYAEGCLSGVYYGNHRKAIDDSNYYVYDLDNGSVIRCGEIYSGFVFKNAQSNCIYVQEIASYIENAFYDLISDGSGSILNTDLRYLSSGTLFCEDIDRSYYLDGTGSYYYIYNQVSGNFNKIIPEVTISFDFSENTKNNYFCSITSTGEDLYFSFYDDGEMFYEINSCHCLNKICFSEVSSGCSFLLSKFKKPFIYFRNVGTGDLLIKSAPDLSNSFKYNDSKIYGCTLSCCSFYRLSPKEGAVISLDVSIDGSEYISKSCYPFSFFYEFKNIQECNPLGIYPVCCLVNEDQQIPLFIYEDLCGNSDSILSQCYQKIKSFYFNSYVDENSILSLDFNKIICNNEVCTTDSIDQVISINSQFQNNFYFSSIDINQAIISVNDAIECCILDFKNENFSLQITGNTNINIVYDFDLLKNKFISYKYFHVNCYSADSLYFICNSCILETLDIFTGSGISYSCTIPESNILVLCACVTGKNTFKKIKIGNINLDEVYLPAAEEYSYNLNTNLLPNNYGYGNEFTGTGGWVNELYLNQNGYINCVEVINYNDEFYIPLQPIYNCFCLDFSENRTSTNIISNKNQYSKSEFYNYYYGCEQQSIYYCCLEFKYYPLTCVYFNEEMYEIPNICVPILVCGYVCNEIFNFPIQALNCQKLKLISDNELVEKIKLLNICLNYCNGLCITCDCYIGNTTCLTIPIVQSPEENCIANFIYPCINIEVDSCFFVQKNINFYSNPFECFIDDPTYELNDLLILITSNVNGGIANSCIQLGEAYNCTANYFCTGSIESTGQSYIPYIGITYTCNETGIECLNCYYPTCIYVNDNQSCPVYFSGECTNYYFYRYYVDNKGCQVLWDNQCERHDSLYCLTYVDTGDLYYRSQLNLPDYICYIYSFVSCAGSGVLGSYNDQESGFKNFIVELASYCQCYDGTGILYDISSTYSGDLCSSFLLDVQTEYIDCVAPLIAASSGSINYIVPSGYWCNFATKIYFCDYEYNNLMSYKATDGDGYNYILPINTGVKFYDTNFSGLNISEESCFDLTGIFNYKFIIKNYCGGSLDCNYFFTCCNCLTLNQSNTYNVTKIFIPSESLCESIGSKKITIEKKYTYSGVQPIYIESNYGINDISYPILTSTLCLFCESCNLNPLSGVYYYMYNINEPLDYKIKIISPDLTTFNCICWDNSSGSYNSISFRNEQRELGIVKCNIAQANVKFICFLNSNCLYRQTGLDKRVCIDILGGL